MTNTMLAQHGDIEQLKNNYSKYFNLNREGIYLHVNKNKFLQGEQIFFTAYLYNQKDYKAIPKDANLYVGLYDAKGKQIEKSMWSLKNGRGYGSITIKPGYKHGIYYLKGNTNWMNNFNHPISNIKKLEILEYEFDDAQLKNKKYSILIKPEGGAVVSNISNTFGFQIIDEKGNGIPLNEGKVIDSIGNIILQNIKSNDFGIGKFSIPILKNQSYFCRFELKNGRILQKKLSRGKIESFALNITGPIQEKRMINVRVNPDEAVQLKKKKFFLAIHRDGQLKLFAFKIDKYLKTFSVDQDILVPGVNIVSLLDQNFNLLAERIIFNHVSVPRLNIETEITQGLTNNDSTQITIKFAQPLSDKIGLSASIVPVQNKGNRTYTPIIGEILLKPYLDRYAQLPIYYLSKFDRKTIAELDILLLIHGKSNFSWRTFKDEIPKEVFSFQHGVTLEGVLKNKKIDKTKSIAIYQDHIDQLKTAEIKKDGSFSIQHAYIIKGEPINLTLLDQKGKMEKPEFDLKFYPKTPKDSIDVYRLKSHLDSLENNQIIMTDVKHLSIEKTVALDNVELRVDSKKNKPTKNPRLTSGFWNSKKITEQDLVSNRSLSNYLRSIGFKVRRYPNQTLMVLPKLTVPMMQPPIIYLNGFQLREALIDFPLNTIDEVYYEHAGLMGSNGGTIYIYRKAGSLVGQKPNVQFATIVAKEGFQKPIEFQITSDPDNLNDTFKKYGCIAWEPHLSADANHQFSIKIPKSDLKKVKLIVEGLSGSGAIISEIKTITLSEK